MTPDDSPDVLLPTGSERVFLVDDEEMLVSVTTDMLKMLGYLVVSAKRSLDALELFRSQCNHFNMVITDLTMPEMTGLELAAELLRIRVDIPIILCTGFTSGEIREKAKSIGICEIMMKPYNISELSQKIRTVLDEVTGSTHRLLSEC